MRTIPIQAHLDQPLTTLARCWKVTRADASVYGFTDHDEDIIVSGVTYKAASGFTASAAQSQLGVSVGDMEIVGVLNSAGITEDDLLAGRWANAQVEIFAVNYMNPSAGIIEGSAGTIGVIKGGETKYTAELRDLMQSYQSTLGEVSTMNCRAKRFGDARCGVALGPYTSSAVTVTAFSGRTKFAASALTKPDDYFRYGDVIWTTGANAGLRAEIKSYGAGTLGGKTFEVQLPMPFDIAPGDQFTAIAGCARTLTACKTFSNSRRFVGEPHKPTGDQLARGPV